MLFTLMAAVAASQALSLRPAASIVTRSATFEKLRDFARADPANPATALQGLAGVVNDILLQQGNATEHLSAPEEDILRHVIDVIIPESMYGSMTTAQTSDEGSLAAAIDAINQCYQDFAARVCQSGDLTAMQNSAIAYQNDLNELQSDVDAKTTANATAWSNLATHMSLISDAPSCTALPHPRTMPSLDVYFEASAYVMWFTAQKEAYWPIRDAYVEANRQLEQALAAYARGLAVRDVAYCDWKRELEEGCSRFSACYDERKAHYLNTVKPAVEENMKMRIEAFKAGETIIHQIKFLLAMVTDQTTPSINTARYQIAFPSVPAKPDCDMSALDDARWVPTPLCTDSCDENTDVGHLQDGYRGCQTHTQSGHLCAEWSDRAEFSDRFPGKGLGEHNFCRNPDHEPDGIWCFKVNGGWEYCNPVRDTQPDCRPGEDIISGTFQHFGADFDSTSDQECNDRCQSTQGCTAWVRGRSPSGNSNGRARCWLTQQVPPVWEADGNRVAGVPGCVMPAR